MMAYNSGLVSHSKQKQYSHNVCLYDIAMFSVQLAMKPTPIKEWSMPGVSEDFQVLIKRDDMTGSSLSGNKVCLISP